MQINKLEAVYNQYFLNEDQYFEEIRNKMKYMIDILNLDLVRL